MAFITAAQFLNRYDARRVGDLVGDTGTRVDAGTLLTDTNLATILADASAFITAACRVSDRYSYDDLNNLATTSPYGPTAYLLHRLTADLAMGLLLKRRAYAADDIAKQCPAYVEALQYIQLLREGERIFDTDGQAEAGLPEHEQFNLNPVDSPPLSTQTAYRYFGFNPYYNNCPF